MPWRITRLKGGGVRVSHGKHVVAKHTTLAKAKKQVRLLNGVEHGMKLRRR